MEQSGRKPTRSAGPQTNASVASKRRGTEFYGRLLGSLFLFAVGAWFVITRDANFLLGGRRNPTSVRQRGILVDAAGLDAVAIGCAVIGLGVINFALGIKSRRRIHVFWVGTALFVLPILYGLWKFALDVYQFTTGINAV
jgi:hypothetical protein